MQKYIWAEKYSVGVKEIDEQHQHFFKTVNEIIEMTGQKNISLKDLLVKITDLNNYAIYHFTTEENFFKHYAYSGTKEHIEAHNAYKKRTSGFISEAEKEGVNTKKIILEIAEFAGSWLLNHIMEMDQKYVEFMHNNGIS